MDFELAQIEILVDAVESLGTWVVAGILVLGLGLIREGLGLLREILHELRRESAE